MKILNKTNPKIEPCGNPNKIFSQELNLCPLLLFVFYSINSNVLALTYMQYINLNLYAFNFATMKWCGTRQSNVSFSLLKELEMFYLYPCLTFIHFSDSAGY